MNLLLHFLSFLFEAGFIIWQDFSFQSKSYHVAKLHIWIPFHLCCQNTFDWWRRMMKMPDWRYWTMMFCTLLKLHGQKILFSPQRPFHEESDVSSFGVPLFFKHSPYISFICVFAFCKRSVAQRRPGFEGRKRHGFAVVRAIFVRNFFLPRLLCSSSVFLLDFSMSSFVFLSTTWKKRIHHICWTNKLPFCSPPRHFLSVVYFDWYVCVFSKADCLGVFCHCSCHESD